MAVLFLKPVFRFWLWKVFSHSIVTLYFSSLYFFCSFRRKIPIYISRVQVSDHWQFLKSLLVLHFWGILGTKLPNLSLLLHHRSAVHLEGCYFFRAFLRELFPLFLHCSENRERPFRNTFFSCSPVQYVSWFPGWYLLCALFCISWLLRKGLPIPIVSLATQGAIYWLPPC